MKTVMDNLETAGFWHFNNDIENSYSGNLQIVKSEISIILLGCTDVPKEPFIIYGTTAIGKKITLYKCHMTSRRMAFPGIPSVEVSAMYCFTGGHLAADKIHFNSALLKISSLNEWVDVGGFTEFERSEHSFSVKYKTPDPIIFFETDSVKFVLLFHRTSPLFKPTHNCTITQETVILIKHKKSFILDEFWDFVSTIKSFLTLAYFSEPALLEIKFKQGKKEYNVQYSGQEHEDKGEKSHRRNFLFTHKTIQTDFASIFNRWSNLNVLLQPVIGVLLEAFGKRNVISENKFLNVMQGIETFHRRRRHNEKEPKEINKTKVTEILAACPIEYQSWLKEKLNFSNEPTLQDRLKELFAEIDDTLKNHLFPNTEELIKQAKNTRNYYTHYNKSLEKKALAGTPLFYLTERLKVFLLIILLKETGITNEQANVIITEGSHYLFNHLIDKTSL
jgi:hypothetical protein